MIIGTAYFVSLYHARRYYAQLGISTEQKLKEGAIHIGKPKGKIHHIEDGRYFIDTGTK